MLTRNTPLYRLTGLTFIPEEKSLELWLFQGNKRQSRDDTDSECPGGSRFTIEGASIVTWPNSNMNVTFSRSHFPCHKINRSIFKYYLHSMFSNLPTWYSKRWWTPWTLLSSVVRSFLPRQCFCNSEMLTQSGEESSYVSSSQLWVGVAVK